VVYCLFSRRRLRSDAAHFFTTGSRHARRGLPIVRSLTVSKRRGRAVLRHVLKTIRRRPSEGGEGFSARSKSYEGLSPSSKVTSGRRAKPSGNRTDRAEETRIVHRTTGYALMRKIRKELSTTPPDRARDHSQFVTLLMVKVISGLRGRLQRLERPAAVDQPRDHQQKQPPCDGPARDLRLAARLRNSQHVFTGRTWGQVLPP